MKFTLVIAEGDVKSVLLQTNYFTFLEYFPNGGKSNRLVQHQTDQETEILSSGLNERMHLLQRMRSGGQMYMIRKAANFYWPTD